jgi:hypothetical protein
MSDLFRFKWQAFNPVSGTKIAIGLIVMMVLTKLTGETWLATGLVAMLAWLTNVPGSLKNRISGMLLFAVGAVAITVVSGQMELALWPNVIAVSVIGLLGTLALAWGTRAFMVGWVLICWAIYAPFLVDDTSVVNCVLAILAGTGVLVALNAMTADSEGDSATAPRAEESSAKPGMDFVIPYSVTVALILALTTYYGWIHLKTDPTLIVGGAFFVIGFDRNKTWGAGIGRVIGLVAGISLGLLIAKLLGPGLMLDVIMIAACGLSFGTMAIHPGAWMFFFMIFVAIGWQGLEREAFDLALRERLYGEIAGVVTAMVAIVFLQWWQNRRLR